jgi:hypothetical protein
MFSILLTSPQAADKFPDVDNYHGRWPVTDLIKMRLKNTSSKHRKLMQKMAAGRFVGGDTSTRKKKAAHIKLKVQHSVYVGLSSTDSLYHCPVFQ